MPAWRALLVPAAVAAMLAFDVSGAAAATLFTNTGHATRVTIGATADAHVVGNFDQTIPPGTLANRCTGGNLHLVVGGNNDVTGVRLRVVGGSFLPCESFALLPTFSTPWTITITGNGAVIGANTRYAATLHNVVFDLLGISQFTGNIETGFTALQPTTATSPITLNFADAGTLSSPVVGNTNLDGNIRLTVPWSLTN